MSRHHALLAIPLLVAAGLAPPLVADAAKVVRISMLTDGASTADVDPIVAAIREVASGDRALELVLTDKPKAGDGTAAGVRRALDELLADKNVDLVVATGVLGSNEAIRRRDLAKPVVAARVLDARLQGAPLNGTSSGSKNLTYVTDPGATMRDLEQLRALGEPKKIAILAGRGVASSIERFAEALEARAKEQKLDAKVLTVDPASPAAAADAVGDAEAAYLFALDELGAKGNADLVAALNAKKVRTLSSRGEPDVREGVLAGLASATDAQHRARRVAIDVLRVAGGEAAGTISVGYQRPESFYLNAATARAIGWEPSFALVAEAEVIGAATVGGRKIDLKSVVDEVLASNNDLAASYLEVQSAAEDVEKALSILLPKVSVEGRATLIDPDRAAAALGTQPQGELFVALKGEAILFSDKAHANRTIQERIQAAREKQHEALRLDVMLEASKAYLGVLGARVIEQVKIENAKKTRANLAQARLRQSVGVAMQTEVLRWESQLAMDQREVLKARSIRQLATLQLNRLLRRPQEEALDLSKEAEDQAVLNLAPERFAPYLDRESRFLQFRELLVEEAIAMSPEIKGLEQAVAAADRAVSAATRSLFVPNLGIGGEIAYRLAKGGTGARQPVINAIPGAITDEEAAKYNALLDQAAPQIDDLNYQVGAILSLPLPLDLEAFSDIRKAEAEKARRSRELESAREKIEQRVRSTAFLVSASYPGVALAKASADAARKNLALAQDAYATGAIGVLDLIDAQNLSLLAELNAVGAQYEFMMDQLELERALGGFGFMKSKEELNEWLQKFLGRLERR
ncbi:TolC family protein [Myxococcota bacterium]|nr:TolC family protein [Myxococcota bacterium]